MEYGYYYPTPNPRVISKKTEKPFEFYLEGEYQHLLLEVLALHLQKVAYAWVVDYTRTHDNYLPSSKTIMFSTTGELLSCLKFSDNFSSIPFDLFKTLSDSLPESEWYVHPTYPLSASQTD